MAVSCGSSDSDVGFEGVEVSSSVILLPLVCADRSKGWCSSGDMTGMFGKYPPDVPALAGVKGDVIPRLVLLPIADDIISLAVVSGPAVGLWNEAEVDRRDGRIGADGL
jgi:hypothetical protein